jgi:hypothetical protein
MGHLIARGFKIQWEITIPIRSPRPAPFEIFQADPKVWLLVWFKSHGRLAFPYEFQSIKKTHKIYTPLTQGQMLVLMPRIIV